jgi:CheY-like chemotaxis protein
MQQFIGNHILIVEDSPDLQILLRELLESSGYAIECTSNGKEALSLLASSKELPQMILLDLRMPVLDGIGFCLKQNSDPRLCNIPVILMSGVQDIESVRTKIKLTDFLAKPYDISDVLNMVKRHSNLH